MTRTHCLALSVWLFLNCHALLADAPLPCFGLNVAAVTNGRVYTVRSFEARPEDEHAANYALWTLPLREDPKDDSRHYHLVRGWCFAREIESLRWHISDGTLYSLEGWGRGANYEDVAHIPLSDVPLLDVANKEGEAALRKKYGQPLDFPGTIGWTFPGTDTESDRPGNMWTNVWRGLNLDLSGEKPGVVEFAHWTRPGGGTSEFMLHKKQMYVSLCYKVAPGRKRQPRLIQLPVRDFYAGFQEPFLIYADCDYHYFVTRSGKVFSCERLDLDFDFPSGRETLWADARRPVTMIVNDPDHMRTFVAGPDPDSGDKGGMFWFELDGRRKPKPEAYKPGAVADLPGPVSAVTHFARFLDQKKLFQLPPDEPKAKPKK